MHNVTFLMQACSPFPLIGQDSAVSSQYSNSLCAGQSRYQDIPHLSIPALGPNQASCTIPGFLPRGKAVRASCDQVKERV